MQNYENKHREILEEWGQQKRFWNQKYQVEYSVQGGQLPPEEAETYIGMIAKKVSPASLYRMSFIIDGEDVDMGYEIIPPEIPFERIRRITGYLVGTLDRFNDAKRAEVEDRLKHETL